MDRQPVGVPAMGKPGMVAAPAPAPAPAEDAKVAAMVKTLKDSMSPAQREIAASDLGDLNPKAAPKAVEGLVNGALDDPAPLVRVACIRSLARMKADTPSVRSMLASLKSDRDDEVRREAELTAKALAGEGVRPVSK
jgi:HEAT repeat protein